MISYIEKGYGLHAAVGAAGHWLRNVDGAWVSSNDAAVQAIIDGYTVQQCIDARLAEIDAHAKALIDKAVAPYSPGEMAGWPIMREEALAMQADLNASTPNIDMEAAFRLVERTVIRDRVLANATALTQLRAAILGIAGRHKDAIRALQTFEAALAYDWSTGWPSV